MKSEEIKGLIIKSLSAENDSEQTSMLIEEAGVTLSFREGFRDRVIDRIFKAGIAVNREIDFLRSMNLAFYRIALTGVAAIAILLISIYFMEGSLSINSFLGLGDNYDESIVCLLTGN
jgi:hypothetical protein